jgi:hypothetical protein
MSFEYISYIKVVQMFMSLSYLAAHGHYGWAPIPAASETSTSVGVGTIKIRN